MNFKERMYILTYIYKIMQHVKKNTIWNKQTQLTVSIIIVVMILFFLSKNIEYIFIANDDLFMRAIISGDFTGVPDPHAVFIMYPLAFIISSFYKLIPSIEWYGWVFLGLHASCWVIFIYRMISKAKSKKDQIFMMLFSTCFLVVVDINHLIMQQFTTLSGILAFTALVCFSTEKENDNHFYIIELVLMSLSFMIRYEMLLMYLPFFLIIMIFHFILAKKENKAKSIKRYILFLGILFVLLGGIFALHKSAYNSDEWKEYTEYNKLRSKLYDYMGIPTYTNENIDFYKEIGIEKEEIYLLQSINTSLDEKITIEILKSIYDNRVEYIDSVRTFGDSLKNITESYIATLFPKRWYTTILYLAYGGLISLGIWKKDSLLNLEIFSLFLLRSGLWTYLIYYGRMLERITYPLALGELAVIIGCYIKIFSSKKEQKNLEINWIIKGIQNILVILMIVILCLSIAKNNINENQNIRNSYRWGPTLFDYVDNNLDNYYILEVMSTSQIVIPMFGDKTKHPENILYAGGWISQLPLEEIKNKETINSTKEKALLNQENVYFIQSEEYDYVWLEQYLNLLEKNVTSFVEDKVNMINKNYLILKVEHKKQ